MIQLKDILRPNQVIVSENITSKKRVLEVIADTAASSHAELDGQKIFEQLIERERLGTTGFGNGVAIPHCRLSGCEAPIIIVLKLYLPIDFKAVDGKPVDVFIGLIVPEAANDEHLQLLKQIATLLSDTNTCKAIRSSQNNEALYQVIMDGVIST